MKQEQVITRIGSAQLKVLLAAFGGWLFDGFEMGLFPIVARPALRSMYHSESGVDGFVGAWMGNITALFLLGAAAGGLIFGWLGDRIGRVRAMAMSILVYSLFTGLGFFAQEPWHLGLFRFIAALGMGGEWSLGVALVMEYWPDKWRPLLAGIIGAASNVGFLLVALVGISISVTTDSWRWMWLVGVLPAFLVFLILLFVPESERWKASAAQGAAAPLREVFSRAYLRNTLLGIAFASIALIGTWGTIQWAPVWVDQMVGQTMPKAKAFIAMLSALGAILGCLVGPLIGGKLGRRPAFFLLCLSSLITCGFLYRSDLSYGLTFQIAFFFAGTTTAAFYGWFPLFLPELFPTRARATGQGVCFNTGRIFAAFGAILGGQLVAYFDGDYARMGAVITLVYILGLVLIWFVPETKGKPLPE
ncbi:MAG TPA: MFS transporter [Candidatus Hydrogenedentes bacterium]|nr:MFS transporter [Candidatus Hydrogenedentota bacterium]